MSDVIQGVAVDYEKSFSLLQECDFTSETALFSGHCYRLGHGVAKNQTKAMEHYTKAINCREAEGFLGYALCLLDIRKHTDALDYLERAGKMGVAHAYFLLGKMHFYGDGIQKDRTRAFAYFEKGHRAGDDFSSHHLGLCYYYGYGCEKKPQSGLDLIELLAQKGDPVAIKWLRDHKK